jgi:hypothetical protein
MKILKRFLLIGIVLSSTLMLNSCLLLLGTAVVAGVGAGTVAYIQGTYTMNMDGSVVTVYNAAIKAVQDNDNLVMKIKTIKSSEGSISGTTKIDNTDFKVEVKKLTNNSSEVSIKFGVFGDREASELLMKEIEKNAK